MKLQHEVDNNSIGILLEQSDGMYKESDTSIFTTDMVYNMTKSGCIDNNGNKIENSLLFSNGLVTIKTNKTLYCYIYFDIKEDGGLTLSETSGLVNQGSTHTFTVTSNISAEKLSATSNNEAIATASISGNIITITGVSSGNTTITITSAETSNYLSSSTTYNVTVQGGIYYNYIWQWW